MVRCTVARATRALDSLRATHCRLTRRVTSSLSEHLMLGLCHTPRSDQPCTKDPAGRPCGVDTLLAGHRPCCKRLRQGTLSPASGLPGGVLTGIFTLSSEVTPAARLVLVHGNPLSRLLSGWCLFGQLAPRCPGCRPCRKQVG